MYSAHKYNNLLIINHTHTQTQDGKTILDAFFASCMRFIKNYLSLLQDNKTTMVCTTVKLAEGVCFKGGMNNTMVQVVTINIERCLEIEKKFIPVMKIMQTYFRRINHAFFNITVTLPF